MPTVTIGNNTGDDYSGTEDAYLLSWGDEYNTGGYTLFDIRDTGWKEVGLIKFSGLSNLPSSITVNSSALYLYLYSVVDTTEIDVSWNRLLRDWIEGTQSENIYTNDTPHSCCYKYYGDDAEWSTPGALGYGTDRSSTVSATGAVDDTTGSYHNFSGSQMNDDIEAFRGGTYSNYGWMGWRSDAGAGSGSQRHRFRSSEYTNGQRPYLYVDYAESSGSTANAYYYMMNQ